MNNNEKLRKIILKNMSLDKVMCSIVNIIKISLHKKVYLLIDKKYYAIYINKFKLTIEKEKVNELRNEGAYSLDKYIINELLKHKISIDTSVAYIKHCYKINNC